MRSRLEKRRLRENNVDSISPIFLDARVRLLSPKSLVPASVYLQDGAIGVAGHPASWTGRFVRVYERPRPGFQFSPIISNRLGVLAGPLGTLLFLSFRLSFSPSFLSSPGTTSPLVCSYFALSLSRRFFGLQTARAFSKHPTWEDLSSAPTSPGSPITSCRYYRRERGVPEEKGVLVEGGTMRPGGSHFRDLWASLRESACM